VTHAEWLVEILDTWCRTWVIAQQTGRRLRPLPAEKLEEILALKSRAGLPDARLAARSLEPPTDRRDTDSKTFVECIVPFL